MRSKEIVWLVFCALLISSAALMAVPQTTNNVNKTAALTVSVRQAVSREILEHTDAFADPDPAAHSLLLFRAGGAWADIDTSRAVSDYREAFSFARQSSPRVRVALEDAILNDLLPLSPSDTSNLLANAESASKHHLYPGLITYWLLQGNYPRAIDAFKAEISNGAVTGLSAEHLLDSIPPSLPDERARVVGELMDFYKAHPSQYGPLAALISHFYSVMVPSVALDGSHFVLDQAGAEDRQHPLGSMGWGSLQFDSHYDVELFTLAPALKQLDAAKAEELISQRPEVVAALKQSPNGFENYLNYTIWPNYQKSFDLVFWSNPSDPVTPLAQDTGLEFSRPQAIPAGFTGFPAFDPQGPEVSVIERLKTCPPVTPESMNHTASPVPMLRKQLMCINNHCNAYPRADLFQFVAAGCSAQNKSIGGHAALQDLIQLLTQIPESDRIAYLVQAADLYLHLSDPGAAADVAQQGFKFGRSEYESELNSKELKDLPKGMWGSAETYRQFIAVAVNASLERTRTTIGEIPDSSLRELEEVMIARALLGVPLRRSLIADSFGNVYPSEGYYTTVLR